MRDNKANKAKATVGQKFYCNGQFAPSPSARRRADGDDVSPKKVRQLLRIKAQLWRPFYTEEPFYGNLAKTRELLVITRLPLLVTVKALPTIPRVALATIPDQGYSWIPDQRDTVCGNSNGKVCGNCGTPHDWNCGIFRVNCGKPKAKVFRNSTNSGNLAKNATKLPNMAKLRCYANYLTWQTWEVMQTSGRAVLAMSRIRAGCTSSIRGDNGCR